MLAHDSVLIDQTYRYPYGSSINTSLGLTSSTSQACCTGGGERDRTDDPLLAKQVLSQLSYTPVSKHQMMC